MITLIKKYAGQDLSSYFSISLMAFEISACCIVGKITSESILEFQIRVFKFSSRKITKGNLKSCQRYNQHITKPLLQHEPLDITQPNGKYIACSKMELAYTIKEVQAHKSEQQAQVSTPGRFHLYLQSLALTSTCQQNLKQQLQPEGDQITYLSYVCTFR